jgi:hypothetical protein
MKKALTGPYRSGSGAAAVDSSTTLSKRRQDKGAGKPVQNGNHGPNQLLNIDPIAYDGKCFFHLLYLQKQRLHFCELAQ